MQLANKFLACGLLAAISCTAHGRCESGPEPEVTVISRQVNLSWDATQSGAELSSILNDGRTAPTLGMTTIQIGYTHDLHLPEDPCKGPSVYVNLSARIAAVAIASELSPKDCHYHSVVEHEMKHFESAQRAVDHASLLLYGRLVTALKAAAAGADRDKAYAVYTEIIEAEAQSAIQDGTEHFSREGAAIDSKEESVRFNLACGPRTMMTAQLERSPTHHGGDWRARP